MEQGGGRPVPVLQALRLLEEMLERTGLVFSDIMKDYEIPDAEPYIRRLENCTTLNQLKLVWADYVSVSCELCQRQKDGMGRPSGADD